MRCPPRRHTRTRDRTLYLWVQRLQCTERREHLLLDVARRSGLRGALTAAGRVPLFEGDHGVLGEARHCRVGE